MAWRPATWSGRRAKTFSAAVLAVLACAAVAFVARGVFAPGDTEPVGFGPAGAAAPAARTPFSLEAAESRAIPKGAFLIARAKRGSISVFRHARARRGRRLRQRIFHGQRIPLVFMVRARRKGWVRVQLPTRPNLSSAWLRRKDVDFAYTRMHVRISLRRHRLELFDAGRLRLRARIGVGQSVSPTPKGRYYVTDVVRATQPRGFFGPYSLGLSAHSNVYSSFEGGDGQVGLHGTNRPAALGTDVSHGCVRLTNKVITRLARSLPLGTPVTIAA